MWFISTIVVLVALPCVLCDEEYTVTSCKALAYEVEEETTKQIKATLEGIVKDTKKLVLLTHDFIEPLEIADIIPFEDKLRNQNDLYNVDTSTTYTETTEMDVFRKIMYENLEREDPNRPLTWYAVGLEPKSVGNTMGGYFGYSTTGSDKYMDSTVHTSAADSGIWDKYPEFGECLRWVHWPMKETGVPDYSAPIDWGYWEPTVRPWYIAGKAEDEGSVLFLEPYQFSTGGAPGIGIGTVAPLHKNGVFKGVIDAEYDISFLSKYLAEQREATDGLIYIYASSGKSVVAISTDQIQDEEGNLWVAGENHPNQLVKESIKLISGDDVIWPAKKSFDDYYVFATQFKSADLGVKGIDWVVVTVWSRVHCPGDSGASLRELAEKNFKPIVALLTVVLVFIIIIAICVGCMMKGGMQKGPENVVLQDA